MDHYNAIHCGRQPIFQPWDALTQDFHNFDASEQEHNLTNITCMTDLDIRVNFLKMANLMLLKFKMSETGESKVEGMPVFKNPIKGTNHF